MLELMHRNESYEILGACINIYKIMGCGLLASVYQECLEIELEYQGITFSSQKELKLAYRNIELKQTYKPGFMCKD